jgi:acetoin utilization protein AcuB
MSIASYKEMEVDNNYVRDWMTPDPIVVSSKTTLPEAFWLMIENCIRRLPVVDEGVLVGIVTLEDIRGKIPDHIIKIDPIRVSDILVKLSVCLVMTRSPKTISPNANLIEAARKMFEYKISTLPVMDGDKLVGIITESDIFRALVKLLES